MCCLAMPVCDTGQKNIFASKDFICFCLIDLEEE